MAEESGEAVGKSKGGASPRPDHARSPAKLVEAVEAGDLAMIASEIAKGADPDAPVPLYGGASALCMAIQLGRVEAAKVLLGCGAKPDPAAPIGESLYRTPLMRACELGGKDGMEMAKALLAAGADPNASAFFGSPLSSAVESLPLVKLLLSKGAAPAAGEGGGCPIMWSAVQGREGAFMAMARALTGKMIEAGAGAAAARQLVNMPKTAKNERCMRALMELGVSPLRKVWGGKLCAVEEAVRNGPEWILEFAPWARGEANFKNLAREADGLKRKYFGLGWGDRLARLDEMLVLAKVHVERGALAASAGPASADEKAALRI